MPKELHHWHVPWMISCKSIIMQLRLPAILLLVLLTGFGLPAFSQSGFHLGLKGGVNMFRIDGQSFREGYEHGYHAGLFAEINFARKWGIQPEILWNQSQTRTSDRFHDIYDEGFGELRGVQLDYLSIPLLLSYRPSRLVSFQLGPQFGLLLNRQDNLFENGLNAFKSGDLSMLGGMQLNIGGFKLGGRYSIGLMNINDIDNRDRWRNEGFQLFLGFRIL